MRTTILNKLLARGDSLAVERGRLIIRPASGKPVPDDWLSENHDAIVRDILKASSMDAYRCVGHSVGRYGPRLAEGLTLQLVSVLTGESVHAVFNVNLKRSRTTQHGSAGTPLPSGCFRVGRRSLFLQFWQSAGLVVPKDLYGFARRMGKLNSVLLIGERAKRERLDTSTLRPLNLDASVITPEKLVRNSWVTCRQSVGNLSVSTVGKDSPHSQAWQGFQPIPATGEKNHGNTVIRERGYTGKEDFSITEGIEQQSVTDWLADYDRAESTSACH